MPASMDPTSTFDHANDRPLATPVATPMPRHGNEVEAIAQAFQSAVLQSGNKRELATALFHAVTRASKVQGAAWFAFDDHGKPTLIEKRHRASVLERENVTDWMVACGANALKQGEPVIVKSTDVRNLLAVCQSTPLPGESGDVVVVLFHCEGDDTRREELLVQFLATQITTWGLRRENQDAAKDLRATAAVMELGNRTVACETLRDAAAVAVNELHAYLGCQQVAIGLRHGEGACRLEAISGLAEFDRSSAFVRKMEVAMDETLVRGELTVWPPGAKDSFHQRLAHRQLIQTIGTGSIISTPLEIDGEVLGVLTCIGKLSLGDDVHVRRLVDAAAQPISHALKVVRNTQRSRLARAVKTFFSHRWATRRRLVLFAIATLLLILMIPVPYRIGCYCTVTPKSRRFAVAPHDGLLEMTFAEPGDLVEEGALLARMDGRELRWKLGGIVAERHRAEKKRDAHAARQEIPQSLLAELEVEKLQSEAELLENRAKHLDIQSPIDGIVLSGSIDRRQNYPATIGQLLYEITPLDSLRVEVAIPGEEMSYATEGQSVEILIDGQASKPIQGTIDRLSPRSEIRDNANVFIAYVDVPNETQLLRPGMQGTARVRGKRYPLGWNLFHHAWERIVTFLRW